MGTQVAPNQHNAPNAQQSNKMHKVRRGARKGPRKTVRQINILTINTRGIKSKIQSLTATLETLDIHIAGITETYLQTGEEIAIPGYIWIGKN